MAGDWIKWCKGLVNKNETHLISESLNMEPAQVAGHLMQVWEWLDDNADMLPNGDGVVTLGALQTKRIDRIVHVTGFGQAMADAGWLRFENGKMIVPNFSRNNGNHAKKRALAKNRTETWRNADSVTPVTPKASPEKRREDTDKPLTPIPGKWPRDVEEVIAYGKSPHCGMNEEAARHFFDTFTSKGWVDANGQPINDWRARMRRWKTENQHGNPNQPPNRNSGGSSLPRTATRNQNAADCAAEGITVPVIRAAA